MSVSLCLFLCLSLSVCLSVCLPACLHAWLSVCLSVSASVSVSVSLSVSVGLCRSLSVSVCLCLSVCVCVCESVCLLWCSAREVPPVGPRYTGCGAEKQGAAREAMVWGVLLWGPRYRVRGGRFHTGGGRDMGHYGVRHRYGVVVRRRYGVRCEVVLGRGGSTCGRRFHRSMQGAAREVPPVGSRRGCGLGGSTGGFAIWGAARKVHRWGSP